MTNICDKNARIFISVAEASADAHAAALVRAARERLPNCRFYGLAGPRMVTDGVERLYDFTSHAAMLAGIFSVIGHAWKVMRLVERSWDANPPDLVVLLDSPELHLRLAAKAKARGIPVLYYIAPQTWASREGRNAKIARIVDRLACILPFEQEYFRNVGINAEYVGHPLFETLRREQPDEATIARLRNNGQPVVAVLPGSRKHVIDAVLPRQLEVLQKLQNGGQRVRVAISAISHERATQIRSHLGQLPQPAEIVIADNASLLTAADLVLVASGTAALHVGHYRTPMIVMYDAGRLLRIPHALFGRFILKIRHLSLLNILANQRIVPEFMPFIRNTNEIAHVARQLLTDQTWRDLMVKQIDEIVAPLENTTASENVCRMIAEMLECGTGL